MSLRDLWEEALFSSFARPGRAALTALGTVIGIATLVTTVGLSRTAGRQIVDRFDELAATQVDIRPASSGAAGLADGASVDGLTDVLAWDSERVLDRLRGVNAAGAMEEIDPDGAMTVTGAPIQDPSLAAPAVPRIVAASPGIFDATHAYAISGRTFDLGHSEGADRVVVLGVDAAKSLGITDVARQPYLWIDDELFAVIGIVDGMVRERGLSESLVIPSGTSEVAFGTGPPSRIVVDTQLGASDLVASQAPLALSPNDPKRVSASPGWEPGEVRRGIETDVTSLLLVLGAISLLVGVIGIANVTLVSVLERVGEIGLRRALGARRGHVAAQFLAESVVVGMLAGVIGAAVGVIAVVLVSWVRDWTPVLDSWLPLVAALVGALAGLLAGSYPAWRASKLEPVEALRVGM